MSSFSGFSSVVLSIVLLIDAHLIALSSLNGRIPAGQTLADNVERYKTMGYVPFLQHQRRKHYLIAYGWMTQLDPLQIPFKSNLLSIALAIQLGISRAAL